MQKKKKRIKFILQKNQNNAENISEKYVYE